MYKFIDVTEQQGADALPAEAMSINGVWIEQEIPGYRTLHVSGREMLESEIGEYQVGTAHGSVYRNKRYVPRVITVTYKLAKKTDIAFREAFNQLNRILDAEKATIVFNDEPDKYFIGTKSGQDNVPPGTNQITSSFDIYCADPFKHSTTQKQFTASANADGILEATIINNGAQPVPIDYEITHNHDNGYIGIVSDGGVIQLGKLDEVDGEIYKKNEVLSDLEQMIAVEDDHGTNYMHPTHRTTGTLRARTINGRRCMYLATAGKISTRWNGAMHTLVLPADSEGVYGAKNFYCYINQWFETGLVGQTAEQSIAFLTEDNKVICGYSLFKSDMSGNTACLEFWANGKILKSNQFTPSKWDSDNPFNEARGHSDIRKIGDKVTFYWFGQYPSYTVPEIKDMECTKIQVAFTQYGDRMLTDKYVTRNYLRSLAFQKLYVEKWRDIPNRYAQGDVVRIDGKKAQVYVNGMPNFGDEITGSSYFLAPPGETNVQFYYSDFSTPAPDIVARIREAYI